MAWQFVYRDTFLFAQNSASLRIPFLFQPGFRIAINAKLLTGLGDTVRSLGTVQQLLFIDGLGDVKGESFALAPFFQLLIPTTEFNFRLLYQPVRQQFSVELSIWVDTLPMASSGGSGGGVDNAAALGAIQSELSALTTAEAGLHDQLITLGLGQAAIATQQAGLAASQTATRADIDVLHTGLNALATGQGAAAVTLAALAASEQTSNAAVEASLSAIRSVLSLPTPTPTPTPTPAPSYLNLLFEGADGSTTFTDSSSYARTILSYGGAQLSTTHAVSGTTSLLLNGSTGYLECVWNTPLINDFTISVDIYPIAIASSGCEIFSITSSNNAVNLLLEIDPGSNNAVRFSLRNDSSASYFDFNSSLAVSPSTWTNVQAIVQGSTAFIKINNAASGSATFTGTRQQGTTRARIGRLVDIDGATRSFNGWIDNFRIY